MTATKPKHHCKASKTERASWSYTSATSAADQSGVSPFGVRGHGRNVVALLFVICLFIQRAIASVAEPSTELPVKKSSSATAPATAHVEQAAKSPSQATLDLEWEAVEGASGYEVKLTPQIAPQTTDEENDKREILKFLTAENKLSERVPVGVYKMQIRSKDKISGYFGPWSKAAKIELAAKIVELLSPANNDIIKDVKSKRSAVLFQWSPVPQVLFYTLKVWSDDPTKAQEFTVRAPSKRLNLISARVYHWEVTFKTKQAIGYLATPQRYSFTLLGPQLVQPVVDRDVGLPHVEKTAWSLSPGAQFYSGKIFRHALDETDWQDYREIKETPKTAWDFDRLPPGVYRVEIVAHAKNRSDSEPGFYEFTVKPTEEELNKALSATEAVFMPAATEKTK
jgi:hypothetical protein